MRRRPSSAAMGRGRSMAGRASPCGEAGTATDIEPAKPFGCERRPGVTSALRRVGLHRPDAVGAVDRPVHPRLERHLGLVPARRAEDREILTHRAVVAALVATWASDLPDVVAGLAARASAGSTARAAFRVADEPLLNV